jgi:hypothetical protein
MEKKRLRMALDPEHEDQLQWLMERWGMNRNDTVSRIISEAAKHLKDQEAAKEVADASMDVWTKLGRG